MPRKAEHKFQHQKGVDLAKLNHYVTWPKLASIKYDGIRLSTQEGRTWTTSLKEIPNKFVQAVLADPAYRDLDGELIVGEPNDPEVYRNTYSGVMTVEGEPDFRFFAFDEMTGFPVAFEKRLEKLRQRNLGERVVVVEQDLVYSMENLAATYEKRIDQGFEGLVVRNPKSYYKYGRCSALSQDCIKMKPYRDDEAIVLGVYEAMENQNESFINERGYTERSSHQENKVGKGMIGGFNARDVKTNVEFRVSAGALTHKEREEIYKNPRPWINSIIVYRHLTIGVKNKPRHGRYMRKRSPLDMSPGTLA